VAHPEAWDEEVRDFVGRGGDPFEPQGVRYLRDVEESKALNERPGPFVVIAGSGMCEGGRILHHLLHGLEDRRNVVLFVGYAAPNTLARRILDGEPTVRVLGRRRDVRARVARVAALSAHAGRSELLRFLAPARERGSALFLVHGDEEACLGFAEALREEGRGTVVVPETYARYPLRRRPSR
jgi:metallo-beta-lactamase family protein